MMTVLCHLGRDAELKTTNSGEPYLKMSLAYSYGRKGDDGKRPTQWVDAVLWGRRGESLAPYLKKGGAVVASMDEVHVETYTKRDGGSGVNLAARVVDITLAGSREGGGQQYGGQAQQPPAQQRQAQPAQQPPAQQRQQPQAQSGYMPVGIDDDVPF